jgi:hypothetical protein
VRNRLTLGSGRTDCHSRGSAKGPDQPQAEAGVRVCEKALDSRLHGNDIRMEFAHRNKCVDLPTDPSDIVFVYFFGAACLACATSFKTEKSESLALSTDAARLST